MKFKFNHFNFNVMDLDRSIKFYDDALGLKEIRRKEAKDGSFIIVYLGDGSSEFYLELTWMRDRKEPYDLGDLEYHLAFKVDDYDAAFKKHEDMGCIEYINKSMGIYFITDPDGYWVEVVPTR
jgi:lactoylglutathione lyase